MIDIRRDLTGIKIAASELWIEMFVERELELLQRDMPPEMALEARAKIVPRRTLAAGYYQWVSYLVWLRNVCALPCAGIGLFADEAEGLLELASAENEFRRNHPPCPYCGALNEKFSGMCRECSKEL